MKNIINTVRCITGITLTVLYFTVYSIIMLPILALIGLFSKDIRERFTLLQVRAALRLVQHVCGIRPTIIGLENIPDTPVLYVSNHRSYFDMIISYPSVPGRLGFVAKKEFKKVFTMGLWMQFAGCFFLDRKNPRAGFKTILDSVDAINAGRSMWICPEGTRNHSEGLLPFRDGSYKIADKAGCPIIPVAIAGSDEVYELAPKGQICPAKVYVVFGKPINTKGLDKDGLRKAHEKVYDQVLSMYSEYRSRLDSEKSGTDK